MSGEPLGTAEREATEALADALLPLGLSREDAVGIWIALKSKPALLLAGSHPPDKDTLAMEIGKTIVGGSSERSLRLQGHPWWAGKPGSTGQLVLAQERLTSLRLAAFLEGAIRWERFPGLHFVLLLGISRAELDPYLVSLPQNLRHDLRRPQGSQRKGRPASVYVLATSDLMGEHLEEGELLDACSVILLQFAAAGAGNASTSAPAPARDLQQTLMASRRFHPLNALAAMPPHRRGLDPLAGLRELLDLLRSEKKIPPPGLIEDAFLFMGNAWNAAGKGLFNPDPLSNAHLACDFWLSQAAIPRLAGLLREETNLRTGFSRWVEGSYPRALGRFESLLPAPPRELEAHAGSV